MKILFLAFVFLLLSLHAKAQSVSGAVKLFSGRSVETNSPYSYYALSTAEGDRIILPSWIDARRLSEIEGHVVVLEGSITYLACSDMSEACPTAEVKKMRWFQFHNSQNDGDHQLFTGSLEKVTDRTLAIRAGDLTIEVPAFIKAQQLLVLDPQITLQAQVLPVGLAPAKLQELGMLNLQF